MPLNTNPFEVRNFSGGLTDHQNTGAPNTYLAMDNLLLNGDGEVFTRYGSVVYNAAQLPSGNQRVAKFINYSDDTALLAFSGTRAFYDNAGTWAEILSPAGGVALPGASASSNFQASEWKRQIFVTSDSQIQPIKIIKDDTLGWRSITAGLPKMASPANYVVATALANAITQANAIRTALLGHVGDATAHKVADTISQGLVGAACTDLPSLLALTSQLILGYQNHFNDYQGAGKYHLPESRFTITTVADQTLAITVPPKILDSAVVILNDLATKLTAHHGKMDIHTGISAVGEVTTAFGFGVTSGPYADLDRALFYSQANNLRASLLTHYNDSAASPAGAHKASDTSDYNDLNLNFPVCNDPYSLRTLIYGIARGYALHEGDAATVTPTYHVHKEVKSHALSYPTSTGSVYDYDYYFGLPAGNWGKAVTRLSEILTQVTSHMNEATQDNTVAHYAGTTNYISNPGSNFWSKLADGSLSNLILANYNYAFTYTYTYTINGVTFLMESEPLFVNASNVLSTKFEGLLIQGIVPLTNDATTNYDLANIKINIYRTTDTGTTYFLVDTVANATTSYTDYTLDTQLASRPALYTTGGVNSNSLPPKAKFVTISNNTGYFANFPGNSNRIAQSQPSIIDGVWGLSFVDLPYDVAGLANFRGVPLAWTTNQTYRLEGQFDSLGNGQIVAVPIATNIGLSGSFSPIVYDNGVVFAAQDGFYLTDGYQVQKINTYWRDTYLNLVRTNGIANQMHGVYERNQRRLWWATNTNSADNDSCYVLDANFPITGNALFSSMNAKAQSANFAPSSLGYFKGQIIRGDTRGYVFKHDPAYRSDPKVNTATAPNTWTTAWVTYSYQSPYYDFGSLMFRKWNPRVNVKCRNNGNLSLQANLFTDNATAEKSALSPLYYRGGSDVIEQRGHVPAGYLRCRNRSLQLTNAFVVMQNSDTFGTATLDRVAKTLTLGANWTGDLVDQVVTFPGDGYTAQFTVASQAGAVLTLSDPGGTLPASGVTKWEVKGYPKDELFQLISYNLHVALLGKNQPVMGASNGANA